MTKVREIKRRIKSVKTTKQITKAMELVAAVKMKKAQDKAVQAKEYAARAWDILNEATARIENREHFLLRPRDNKKSLILVISTDRGLCGGLNGNLFRSIEKFIEEKKDLDFEFIIVGKRGQDYFRRRGKKIIAGFSGMDNLPHIVEIRPMSKIIFDGFKREDYGQALVAFNRFVSTTSQYPIIKPLLPITKNEFVYSKKYEEEKEEGGDVKRFVFEPSPEEVLDILIPRLVEIQVYQAVLESNASEHSARMIAMHGATKNSQELLDNLLFSYNRSRQEGITREISEISSGAEALKG